MCLGEMGFNVEVGEFLTTNYLLITLISANSLSGEMGFNVEVGGYMSIKRVAAAVPLDLWIPAEV